MIRPNDTINTGNTVGEILTLKNTLLAHINLYRRSIERTKGEEEIKVVDDFIRNFERVWRDTGFEEMSESDYEKGLEAMDKSGIIWTSSAVALREERKKDIA